MSSRRSSSRALEKCFEASRRGADTAIRGSCGVSGRMKRTPVCGGGVGAFHGLAIGWGRPVWSPAS